VNQFQAAGGPGFVLRELLDAGCLHADVATVDPRGLRAHTRLPGCATAACTGWRGRARQRRCGRAAPGRQAVLGHRRPALLQGNLGRSVIKTSAVPDHRHVIEAPGARLRQPGGSAGGLQAGELERDLVAVVRFQGPRANGMPELHKLTPPLAVLQGKGFRVRWSPTAA
jgi:phosphogluconate dehydratase